ncbi:hypothetical protein CN395_25045 [Priestia megaterium]|uniref:hypothetical protein n=1 Tax=Priestia megaterium TaxID=1404 RepID=UPI000BF992D2|nr:hypothetical protein [Priestia megaterium]PEU54959.1 hypothetical protein CN395_25045 [Priestia megaterium]
MKGKKEFIIPTNVNEGFEIFGVPWKQFCVSFPPFIGTAVVTSIYTPLSLDTKVMLDIVLAAIPVMGTKLKAYKRENINGWTYLKYHIDFYKRQRVFKYRKEGYYHEANQFFAKDENAGNTPEEETSGISSTEDTSKSGSFRLFPNKRQQASKSSGSERSKHAANE